MTNWHPITVRQEPIRRWVNHPSPIWHRSSGQLGLSAARAQSSIVSQVQRECPNKPARWSATGTARLATQFLVVSIQSFKTWTQIMISLMTLSTSCFHGKMTMTGLPQSRISQSPPCSGVAESFSPSSNLTPMTFVTTWTTIVSSTEWTMHQEAQMSHKKHLKPGSWRSGMSLQAATSQRCPQKRCEINLQRLLTTFTSTPACLQTAAIKLLFASNHSMEPLLFKVNKWAQCESALTPLKRIWRNADQNGNTLQSCWNPSRIKLQQIVRNVPSKRAKRLTMAWCWPSVHHTHIWNATECWSMSLSTSSIKKPSQDAAAQCSGQKKTQTENCPSHKRNQNETKFTPNDSRGNDRLPSKFLWHPRSGLATRFAKGYRLLTLNGLFNRFVVTGTGTDSKNE